MTRVIMTRAGLHGLVDALPDAAIESTAMLLTLQAAPLDDEPLTPDEIAAIEEGRGQRGISLEEFKASVGD